MEQSNWLDLELNKASYCDCVACFLILCFILCILCYFIFPSFLLTVELQDQVDTNLH